MTNDSKTEIQSNTPKTTAFAVGGLGGNNAHGAGFLQAALDENVEPEMITCTSGQIYWVYRYLEIIKLQKEGKPHPTLREELQTEIEKVEPFPFRDLNLMTLGMIGKSDAIRMVKHEWLIDIIKNSMKAFERVVADPKHPFFIKEFMSTIPARLLVMEFPDDLFRRIETTFNTSHIGLAFNSFDPTNGIEIVHLNEKAKGYLNVEAGSRRTSGLRERTLYKDIKDQYVRDGLWIYQYGFDDNDKLDGAYYRQIMLDELMPASDVFVARPVSQTWLENVPTSWIELEDMKTEMSFNGSYQGERDKIFLVNTLLKKLTEDKIVGEGQPYRNYHPVTLHEIEIESQKSFFDYVFEDMKVFDRAYQNSKREFSTYMHVKKVV